MERPRPEGPGRVHDARGEGTVPAPSPPAAAAAHRGRMLALIFNLPPPGFAGPGGGGAQLLSPCRRYPETVSRPASTWMGALLVTLPVSE